MKIAVICLAYLGNPSGIRLLSRYFAHTDAHLFVHVDAKVPIEPYLTEGNAPNVTLLPMRHEIFWGGFNTVLAVVSAIEFAQRMMQFDRFVLTTENSTPLVSPREMQRQFSLDIDWIAVNALNPPWVWERYNRLFCFDTRATSFRYFEAEERFVSDEDLERFERLRVLAQEGKCKLSELYHGCGWWALTRETIDIILDLHHTDKHLRESFEFSAIPEEQYFHTIIGRSKLVRERRNFMYVDWDRDDDVKPYVFSSLDELTEVKNHNPELLFARKTDLDSSEVEAFAEQLAN